MAFWSKMRQQNKRSENREKTNGDAVVVVLVLEDALEQIPEREFRPKNRPETDAGICALFETM